jgi:hypothetical protein
MAVRQSLFGGSDDDTLGGLAETVIPSTLFYGIFLFFECGFVSITFYILTTVVFYVSAHSDIYTLQETPDW